MSLSNNQHAAIEVMLQTMRKHAIEKQEAFFQETWMKTEIVMGLLSAGYYVVEGINDSCVLLSKNETTEEMQVTNKPNYLKAKCSVEGSRDIKVVVGSEHTIGQSVRAEL